MNEFKTSPDHTYFQIFISRKYVDFVDFDPFQRNCHMDGALCFIPNIILDGDRHGKPAIFEEIHNKITSADPLTAPGDAHWSYDKR